MTRPVQINTLIYFIGREVENVYKTSTFSNKYSDSDFDTVSIKFEAHFVPRRNITYKKNKFQSRESITTFTKALYELIKRCDFANKNREIKDRFVIELPYKKKYRNILSLPRTRESLKNGANVRTSQGTKGGKANKKWRCPNELGKDSKTKTTFEKQKKTKR